MQKTAYKQFNKLDFSVVFVRKMLQKSDDLNHLATKYQTEKSDWIVRTSNTCILLELKLY